MEESNTIQEQPTSDASVSAVLTPAPAPAPAPAPTPEELKRDQMRRHYIELQKQNYEKCIEVVMNQTTYTREEAITCLQKHKGNVMLVVKEFLGIPEKNEPESIRGSLNQKRYGVIRNFMDKAATSYIKTQERNKIVNEILENQKRAREEPVPVFANTIVSTLPEQSSHS